MRGVITIFAGIALLVLAVVVVRGLYAGGRSVLAAGADAAHTGLFSVGGTGPQAQGPYTIHGRAIMDESQGIPAVPYIEYFNTDNATTTKQLVYLDQRACAPGAGDYPCVFPYQATDGYPQLTTGQAITVTGYIYEDRFLITALSDG